jgi:hypothetical protein
LNGDAGSRAVPASLSGEAFRERLRGVRFHDICRRHDLLFLDLGEQPGLNCGARPLLFRIATREATGLEDYGAQLGDASATSVIEVHKRKAGPGHRILEERNGRCRRKAMLAAQVEKSADKAVPAVRVRITAARPVALVGKKREHEVEKLHRFSDLRLWIGLIAPEPGDELSVSGAVALSIAARSRQSNRLNQRRIVVLDVADARAHRPRRHRLRWVGREQGLQLGRVGGLFA